MATAPDSSRWSLPRIVQQFLRRFIARCVAPDLERLEQRLIAELESLRTDFEQRLTAELGALRTGIERRLSADEAVLESLRTDFEQRLIAELGALRTGIERRLSADEAVRQSLRTDFEQRSIAELGALRTGIELRLSAEETRLNALRRSLQRLEEQLFPIPYVNPEFDRPVPDPAAQTFDYVSFEHKFRGPAKMIEHKLRFYLPYVRGLSPVVDLGCGRGEFLSILREAGIDAVGVERHDGQVAECRRKDLRVVHADMFDHLRAVDDASIGVVFSAQVIEHLAFDRLNLLFRLAARKIRPGGLMIAETVNPHCPAAFKFFWLDPTHVAPLFPEVVQFLAQSAGFDDVQILYPAADRDGAHLYHESGDYAVVARRPLERPDLVPSDAPLVRDPGVR